MSVSGRLVMVWCQMDVSLMSVSVKKISMASYARECNTNLPFSTVSIMNTPKSLENKTEQVIGRRKSSNSKIYSQIPLKYQ